MRPEISRRAVLLAAILASATGCDSLFGDSENTHLEGNDGGLTCEKDREELSEILVQPRSCSTTADCPVGSFCDEGTCDWQCYTDSDCGFGNSCSCDGICSDQAPDSDGGVDPSCARDSDLLAPGGAALERRCVRDEHCPLGARCDEVTRWCTYDCTSNADCDESVGEVCDCSGTCVLPGEAPDEAPPPTLPDAEVTPQHMPVRAGFSFGPQAFTVEIASSEALPAGMVPRAYVEIVGPGAPFEPAPVGDIDPLDLGLSPLSAQTVSYYRGVPMSEQEADSALSWINSASAASLQTVLQLSVARAQEVVDGAPWPSLGDVVLLDFIEESMVQAVKTEIQGSATTICDPGITPRSITLSDGEFVVDTSAGFRATASFSVARCDGDVATGPSWTAAVSTYLEDTNVTPPVRYPVDYQLLSIGPDGVAPDAATVSATGVFEGVLVEQVEIGEHPLSVPVRAWATTGNQMVLFDEARLLSESGRIGLTLGGQSHFVVLAPAGDTSELITGRASWLDDDISGRTRSGSVAIELATAPDETVYTYRLQRVGDSSHPLSGADSELSLAPSCSSDADCSGSTECETLVGRCLPGALPASGLVSSVAHPTEELWRSGASFLEDANAQDSMATKVERLLCYDYPASIPLGAPISIFRFNDDPTLALGVAGDTPCLYNDPDDDQRVAQSAVGLVTTDPSVPDSMVIAERPDEGSGWLAACVDALERQPTAVGNTSVEKKAERWFGSVANACVNLPQVIPALGMLAHRDLDSEPARHIDRTAATRMQRLLAQWLDVHAFTLSQGVQEIDARGTLASDPAASGEEWSDVEYDELLDVAERGWDLLLDRTFAEPLERLDRDVLRYPDYRLPRPDAYWSFYREPGASAGHIIDRVGNHHADLSTGTGFQRVHTTCESSLRLGASSFAELPAQRLKLANDVTVSFWLEADDPGSSNRHGGIIDDFWGGFRVFLYQASNGDWTLYIGNDADQATIPWQSNNGWVHVVVTREDLVYDVYIDGTKVHSFTVPSIAEYDDSYQVRIGQFWPYTDFSYGLDELAVWSRSLGAADVQTLFEAGRGTGTSNCVGRWGRHPVVGFMDDLRSPESTVDHEQGLGLPVKIIDTAKTHVHAVEAFARAELTEVYGSCYLGGSSSAQKEALDRASRSLRYVASARALAYKLYRRSGEMTCVADQECQLAGASYCGGGGFCRSADGSRFFDPPVEWSERYATALDELSAAYQGAADGIAAMADCENPLGIDEDDLPLYFGDVAGDNSRFFAASDYMLDGHAKPAVISATSSLEQARSAWLSKRQSEIQQRMNDLDYERRLEQIELNGMREVIGACGLEGVGALDALEAFEAGDLSLATCFRVPGCDEDDADCLRGSLGSAVLSMREASNAIYEEQRSSEHRFAEWMAALELARQQEDLAVEAAEAMASYQKKAARLRQRSKGLFSGVVSGLFGDFVSDVVSGCMDGLFSLNIAGCIGGALNSDAGAAEELAAAREEIDFELQMLQYQSQLINYYAEVEKRQRAFEYGLDNMEARRIDFEQATFAFDEALRRAARALAETRAALTREQARDVPSLAHHYWLDEKVERFQSDMERARRLTYLSILALEYEFQQSFALRTEVLSADHPDQLLDVLLQLDAQRATRSINARRPSGGTEVLSLRKDILGLSELSGAAPGERTDDSTRRLQKLLTSEQRAVYGDDGTYLGQSIAFTVAPEGALAHRCAERLWRVSATIQGDLTAVDEPGTNVFLSKRNVFKSQWCTGLGDGSELQEGSIYGANLFDPSLTNDEASYEFATARLYPWFNVRRSDFFRDAYTEGASEELAGRGLYGEYELLFPYEGMLEPPTDCNISSNEECVDVFRDLSRIEDVLLRFDYYSVDDLNL